MNRGSPQVKVWLNLLKMKIHLIQTDTPEEAEKSEVSETAFRIYSGSFCPLLAAVPGLRDPVSRDHLKSSKTFSEKRVSIEQWQQIM